MKGLLIISLLIVLSVNVLAQQDSDIELDEVVITDNRIGIPLSEVDRSIQVLTKSQIQSSPAGNIEELLSAVAGIDIRQRGVDGVQADIGIRGSTFEQVLILINGIKMSDVQTGHHSLDLPLSLEAVERIVIVKGPSARRYGQNAFAGVVDIITHPNVRSSLEIGLKAAEFGSFGADAKIQTGGEKFRQMIQSGYSQSDGYRHNTDSKKMNIWYQGDLRLKNQNINFQAGFVEKKFGANGFYATPEATEQYEETQSSIVSAKTNFNLGRVELNTAVYWRRHQDMYLFVRDKPEIYRNLHIGNTLGANLNGNYLSKLGETGMGVEFKKDFLSSNNLGKQTRTAVSLFLEHQFKAFNDKFSITPGILLADFNDFGTFFYPGVDLAFAINSQQRIYGNIGKTYRIPTYTDLYYEDAVTAGNPDLKPEEAVAMEIGYRFQPKRWNIEINGFYRKSKNLIDWIKENENQVWKAENIAEVNLLGFETNIKHYFNSKFLNHFSIGYTYLDNQLKKSSQPYSKYSLDNLKHQVSATLNHQIVNKIKMEWSYRYFDRVTLDDYQLLDAQMMIQFKRFEIRLLGHNLFNTSYTETNLIPMPGRWFGGEVRVRF